MAAAQGSPPVVLVAAAREDTPPGALAGDRYRVVYVHTGTLAVEWARDIQPDIIILDAHLPDMSGLEACQLLQGDPRIGHSVPILVRGAARPTPEQRVTALRAGAWDFLPPASDLQEWSLKLQTYLQAKRSIDVALAEGLIDPATGLHNRLALARRARELGALMARKHGALACVVVAVETDPASAKVGILLARTARVSDVVGALGPTEFAVLAPATDQAGAVKLATRVVTALEPVGGERSASDSPIRVGYDAVANLGYAPIDPVQLLARASLAVRSGVPEPGYAWLRRFDGAVAPGGEAATRRITQPALVSDERRVRR